MELKWLGTAGFEFKTGNHTFFVDPFLSRNKQAHPKQDICPSELSPVDQIFISHGHFDHIRDIPQIALQNSPGIYCSTLVAEHLINKKIDSSQIVPIAHDQIMFDFQAFQAQAFFSTHIRFDLLLVLSTLLRMNLKILNYLSLLRNYPCGQVLSWRFFIEDKIIQFFGSGGSTLSELEILRNPPIDILLVPLQGHSNICDIGLEYVRVLKPKIVIPHHFDNFFPPISQQVNIQAFIEKMHSDYPQTRVVTPRMNKAMTF